MIWNKYTIKTTTDDADMVSAVLLDSDICDVQVESDIELTEDELNQMYADFIKEPPEGEVCYVSFFMEFGETPEEIEKQNELIRKVRDDLDEAAELFGIAPVEFLNEKVDSEDWENKWKEFFKPFTIGDIVIKPTWEPLPEEMKGTVQIDIDPGMAFGTGRHESTKLCLEGLCKYLKDGDSITDIGCGSGILGIAALKKNAGYVTAFDIDPQAAQIAKENFEINEISPDSYTIFDGNVLEDKAVQEKLEEAPADIVLANILASVIEPLTKDVHRYLKSGGYYVTSGIIDNKQKLIEDAVKANECLEYVETVSDGDWRSIVARRK